MLHTESYLRKELYNNMNKKEIPRLYKRIMKQRLVAILAIGTKEQ